MGAYEIRAPSATTEVVNACSRAGEAVWTACRPTDPGEQLDLFAFASIES
ncbi:hypothetical protein [Micromonospora sp. NBC_01638]|nr:hypothetical protein OG811_01715 [Micromonospora sp. NBC_01638]